MCAYPCLCVPARLRVELQRGVTSQATFPILCPHGRSQLALRVPLHGRRVRQAPPWASAPCQFSASQAALQTGRSEDLLEYRFLAFSLASELFVALTDMKITYQRGMTLLLSKSGFHLSPERAVMTVVFFPITSLNFSCTVVFKCSAGDWLNVQTAGGSLFLCSASHQ